MRFDGGMDVEEIGRTQDRDFPEVGASREQRVEGLQSAVARSAVTAVDVRPQAEARPPWQGSEGVAGIGRRAPGPNAAVIECSPLIDELDVVVPRARIPRQARADGVAPFEPEPL